MGGDNRNHVVSLRLTDEEYDALGYLSVPATPEAACIESMCSRYDHSFGLKRYIYSKKREETDEEFECRRDGTRRIMRQLYEEATGQGFFKR